MIPKVKGFERGYGKSDGKVKCLLDLDVDPVNKVLESYWLWEFLKQPHEHLRANNIRVRVGSEAREIEIQDLPSIMARGEYIFTIGPSNGTHGMLNGIVVRTEHFFDQLNEYKGPKLVVFPDSNTRISSGMNPQIRQRRDSLLSELGKRAYVNMEQVPIILKEREGLESRVVTVEDRIGWRYFEERYGGCAPLNRFFEMADDYCQHMIDTVNSRSGDCDLWAAARNVNALLGLKHDTYRKFMLKAVEKYRNGNKDNIFADKCLALYNLAFNIQNTEDISIIVTGDSDIALMIDILMQRVLPKFLAERITNCFVSDGILAGPSLAYQKKVEKAVREHIFYPRLADDQQVPLGIVYNWMKGEFYKYSLPSGMKGYFAPEVEFRQNLRKAFANATGLVFYK